jgi:hypothetical protein
MLNFNDALVECNKMCAHLASYVSLDDQSAAEQHFISTVGAHAARLSWQLP